MISHYTSSVRFAVGAILFLLILVVAFIVFAVHTQSAVTQLQTNPVTTANTTLISTERAWEGVIIVAAIIAFFLFIYAIYQASYLGGLSHDEIWGPPTVPVEWAGRGSVYDRPALVSHMPAAVPVGSGLHYGRNPVMGA